MQQNINTADVHWIKITKNKNRRTRIPDTYRGIPLEALQQPTMHQACQSTPVHSQMEK